ncbi:MAG: hypothetical protein A2048_10400 [Deltaproteobacteria bacterium GWA2_45_12]|nr:MAG: hypothetical protein A2048_10400 [Deltaproteobacteria bacterium GWA2_45_12]
MSIGYGHPITLRNVWEVAQERRPVRLPVNAREAVQKTRQALESATTAGQVMYGVNTGFGKFADCIVPPEGLKELQLNLIRSHAAGVGEPVAPPYVRAMMLLRANSIAQGYSGVRPEVIDLLVELLNRGVTPYVSLQGSVGASGDLVPLAQIALVLIGEGHAYYDGQLLSGAEALRRVGLEPLVLEAKEGLSLINGTQFMTGIAALTMVHAFHLMNASEAATALMVEVTGGRIEPFDPRIHAIRGQSGQIEAAQRIRRFLLKDGQRSQLAQNHPRAGRVQDPYDLRCAPQVSGAIRQNLIRFADDLGSEANGVTDNPLVFVNSDGSVEVISGGNFHGQPVAMAADGMALGLARMVRLSHAQIAYILTSPKSGLPTFLVTDGESGTQSGFMMIDVAAASLAAEAMAHSSPASVLSLPTAGGQEDDVSMGPIAARRASYQADLVQGMLALQFLSGAQALDYLEMATTAPLAGIHHLIREGVPYSTEDRSLTGDIAYVEALLATGAFSPFVDGPQ